MRMRYFVPLLMIAIATHASAFGLLGARDTQQQVPSSSAQLQLSFAPIVKRTSPAVVNIYTRKKVVRNQGLFADPFFEQLFGKEFGFGVPRARMESSLGSGVMIDPKGQLVTSYHVVEGAEDIVVVLHDRREFNARLLRSDPQSDLALLEIENHHGAQFHALQLRDSDTIEVGDLVLALGNPFGVGQTVTSGIISAEGRPVNAHGLQNYFIQTDAAINPGNSGGALVDMAGELVGINTAIFSKSGGSHGVGFAIPSNIVKSFLRRKVSAYGRVVKPWFGARFQQVTREVANALGLPTPSGVLVKDLYDSSPAKAAGMQSGDVIIRAAGRDIPSVEALRYVMNTSDIGAILPVAVRRAGKEITLQMRVIAPPDTPARDVRVLKGRQPFAGTKVANLNPALSSELQIPYIPDAVVVLEDRRYLQQHDIVVAVNGTPITHVKQLEALLRKQGAQAIALQLLRGGKPIGLQVR
jgi:Do/DeqQ family serine protease